MWSKLFFKFVIIDLCNSLANRYVAKSNGCQFCVISVLVGDLLTSVTAPHADFL